MTDNKRMSTWDFGKHRNLRFDNIRGEAIDKNEKTLMKETAHYCEACVSKLSPITVRTGKEKEFWNAGTFPPVTTVDYKRGPHTIQGICDRCGQAAVVIFYRIPKPSPK